MASGSAWEPERDGAADARDRVAGESERAADARQVLADERDRAADERDRVADERDRVADERDRVADDREIGYQMRQGLAEERERLAEQRERLADERERRQDRREVRKGQHERWAKAAPAGPDRDADQWTVEAEIRARATVALNRRRESFADAAALHARLAPLALQVAQVEDELAATLDRIAHRVAHHDAPRADRLLTLATAARQHAETEREAARSTTESK